MRDSLIELIVNADVYDSYDCKLCNKNDDACDRCFAKKLADHLLANGVIVPPCKVGDVVFRGKIDLSGEHQIKAFLITHIITEETASGILRRYRADGECTLLFTSERIGKTVFLTREEAERALKGGAEE